MPRPAVRLSNGKTLARAAHEPRPARGGTITAAAAIMIVVFGSFILRGQRVIKEFGVGLSAAILVDAVIIRMSLVPSLILLIGKANWWFPRWLDRVLPRIHVEPEDPVRAGRGAVGPGGRGRPRGGLAAARKSDKIAHAG